MTAQDEILLAALARSTTVEVLVGTFVSAAAATFSVDVGGGRIPAFPLTSYLPEVNEPVWVVRIDGTPYVTGPTRSKPDRGTVVSVSSGIVLLSTALGNIPMPYLGSTGPSAGQLWKILWHGGPIAAGLMSAAGTIPVAPPAPGGGGGTHVDTFTAIDSGSFQSGRWWTGEVWAGTSNLGAWFYGSKIADTIPAGATVSKLEIYISAFKIFGSAPNFANHAYLSKPGSSPSFGSTTAVGIANGWVTLPTAMGTALKSGGSAAGIGVVHGGDNRMRSLAEDGQSGALRITWS